MTDDARDELLREVRAMGRKLDALAAEVRALNPQHNLVRQIARAVGGHDFNSRELVARARQVPELRVALQNAIGGNLSTRRLGRQLRRLEGLTVEGCTIVLVGGDRDGLTWMVRHEED